VIIDSSDIGSGADANFANRGRLIAAVGKNALCNLEQFFASGIGGSRPAMTPGSFGEASCAMASHFQTLV
jgi:hypothetical protein